jgi:GlcNAc-PI de-N-acetylase
MGANNEVSCFVGAHQDDWQIFAGDLARDDVARGTKVVLVYITAGNSPDVEAFWRAREAGALASTMILAPGAAIAKEDLTINGRPICRWTIGNTASYFLRLPECTLRAFKAGQSNLKPVDGSASYYDWATLVKFVDSIIELEARDYATQKPWVHTSDYLVDPFPIPGLWMDHEDHAATGDIVRMIARGKYNVRYWAGYEDTRRRQEISSTVLPTASVCSSSVA